MAIVFVEDSSIELIPTIRRQSTAHSLYKNHSFEEKAKKIIEKKNTSHYSKGDLVYCSEGKHVRLEMVREVDEEVQ